MKAKKRKNKLDKWFLLTWKRVWIIIVSCFAAIMLHNIIYGLFKNYFDSHGGDEPFFFIIAIFIIPIYVLVCVIYSLIELARKR